MEGEVMSILEVAIFTFFVLVLIFLFALMAYNLCEELVEIIGPKKMTIGCLVAGLVWAVVTTVLVKS
jgi:hypothetical protein